MSGRSRAVPRTGSWILLWGLVVAPLAAVAAAASGTWQRLSLTVGASIPYALVAAILGLCTVPFVIAASRGETDIFEPTVILAVVWVFSYAIPALTILAGNDVVWAVFALRARSQTESLVARGLLASLLGLATLFLAYYLPLPRGPGGPGATVRGTLGPRRFRFWAVIIAATATLVFFLLAARVGGFLYLVTHLNDRVRLFAGLNWLAVIVVALLSVALLAYARQLASRGRATLGLILFTAFALGVNALLGSKTNILSSLVALLVCRHYLRATIPVRTALVVGVVAVALSVAFDLFLREYLVLRSLVTVDFGLSASALVRTAWAQFSSGAFLQLQTLMLIIDAVPDILPLQLGRPYLALALSPIPRALFPGKPAVGTEIFSRALFPESLEGGTSFPTSLLGEFYMNFGLLGVVLGCAAAGFVLRLAYRALRQRRSDPASVSLYGLLIGMLFPWIRGDTFGPTVFFVAVALPLVVLARLSRVTTRPEEQRG